MTTQSRSPIRAKIEACLAQIANPHGQGRTTFLRTYEESSRASADYLDRMESCGAEQPPLAGLVVSIKDLFDVCGETTLAGSTALVGAAPAERDAEVVRRLRLAGAVVIGKTNMTEFAFSGLGINPHYGTPLNPFQREARRIPGGSSSGAPISVTDGMADAALGTDTGGSVRIPAALCGIVGFKPTARTIPMRGTLPLSPSLDSIGPLARDVRTCRAVYDVLSDSPHDRAESHSLRSIKLLSVTNYVTENMDPDVSNAYGRTLNLLSSRGVEIEDINLRVLAQLPDLFEHGGIVTAEAFAWHQKLLQQHGEAYDPRVKVRIARGGAQSAAHYLNLVKLRAELTAAWSEEISAADAVIMPTVPIIAPTLSELEDDDAYTRANLLMLRNPTVVNALDGCAITLPCHEPGSAPVGLMLAASGGADRRLLAIAAHVEDILGAR